MSGDSNFTEEMNYEVFDLETEIVSNLAFNSLILPTVLLLVIFYRICLKMGQNMETAILQRRQSRSTIFYSNV